MIAYIEIMRIFLACLIYAAFMVLMEHLLPWAPHVNGAVTTAAIAALMAAFMAGIDIGGRTATHRHPSAQDGA